jgi:hypothetical protein
MLQNKRDIRSDDIKIEKILPRPKHSKTQVINEDGTVRSEIGSPFHFFFIFLSQRGNAHPNLFQHFLFLSQLNVNNTTQG